MQIKLLKDIVSSIVGQNSAKIVDLLYEKKNVNEFLIAKKLKLTINQTRNILYRLADEGLVGFVRKKDSKKGGWYTYFWTLNTGKSLIKFRQRLERDIENLKKQINTKRTATFFYCPNCNIEYTEESALINEYTCPECGEILQLKDNAIEIANLEKEVEKYEEMLREVNEEIGTIEKKEVKLKERRIKAEAKRKSLERKKKKQEREAAKKRTKKKISKKKKMSVKKKNTRRKSKR